MVQAMTASQIGVVLLDIRVGDVFRVYYKNFQTNEPEAAMEARALFFFFEGNGFGAPTNVVFENGWELYRCQEENGERSSWSVGISDIDNDEAYLVYKVERKTRQGFCRRKRSG